MGRNWHRRHTRRHLNHYPKWTSKRRKFTIKDWIIAIIIIMIGLYFLSINQEKIINLDLSSNLEKIGNDFSDRFSDVADNVERNTSIIEQRIFILTNQERQRNGARDLELGIRFSQMAKAHSKNMINNNFFEHSNYNVGENIGEVPIHYNVVGCGPTLTDNQIADCMVKGWIESPGHHANMIMKSYQVIGIGVACDASRCRGTQTFG